MGNKTNSGGWLAKGDKSAAVVMVAPSLLPSSLHTLKLIVLETRHIYLMIYLLSQVVVGTKNILCSPYSYYENRMWRLGWNSRQTWSIYGWCDAADVGGVGWALERKFKYNHKWSLPKAISPYLTERLTPLVWRNMEGGSIRTKSAIRA